MTELAQRMALHTGGQITWPEPDLRRTCIECGHFTHDRGKTKGRCALVRAHQRIDGVMFDGSKAIACPQIKVL